MRGALCDSYHIIVRATFKPLHHIKRQGKSFNTETLKLEEPRKEYENKISLVPEKEDSVDNLWNKLKSACYGWVP